METINLAARKNQILSVFNQAITDLGKLNADIDNVIEANNNEIADKQAENKELKTLKASNDGNIKFFTKLFKA